MKRTTALLLGASLLFLSGCSNTGTVYSNYRELEEIELILSMGFDLSSNGLRLSMSGGSTNSDNGDQAQDPVTRMAANGASISEAMEILQDFATKEELFYAHTQYVLVGEQCAEEKLPVILDYLQVSSGVRASVPFFIVHEDTAEQLITHCGSSNSDITKVLNSTIRDSQRRGDGYPFSCGEIISALDEYGAALAMALKTVPTNSVEPSAPEEAVSPLPDGYAILKNDTIVDYIPKEDSRGVNLLMGHPGIGAMTVEDPHAGTATLGLTKCKVKLHPVWSSDGSLSGIRADIDANVYIKELEYPEHFNRNSISNTLSTQLETWVRNVLQIMSDTKADFLGIGNQLRMQSPRAWDNAPKTWEQVIGNLRFDVQAHCTISRTGDIQR